MIRVQEHDFDAGLEVKNLSRDNAAVGGVCSFVGFVRDFADGETVSEMTLEHYPGMTEKQLEKIEAEAHKRWPLDGTTIIHRYGCLTPGDQIVFVGAASAHRQAAFEACQFLMDWLKTKAPFWKKENLPSGSHWVAAKDCDDEATQRWDEAVKGQENGCKTD